MTSAVLVVAGTEATAIVLALSVLHMTGSTYWVSAVLAASLGLAMPVSYTHLTLPTICSV